MEPTCVCPDCKAIVADVDGPNHAYFGSNAGCWRVYGEILEKEYSDQRYMKVHRLTVDAYAAQHPGRNEPRAVQSVNAHLVALYLALEQQRSFEFTTKALGKLVKNKQQFRYLPPPQSLGALTVVDVVVARSPEEHADKVHAWARSVWQAWQLYRKEIEALARAIA